MQTVQESIPVRVAYFSDFSISYLDNTTSGKQKYLPLKSDSGLYDAILRCCDPCLMLKIDVCFDSYTEDLQAVKSKDIAACPFCPCGKYRCQFSSPESEYYDPTTPTRSYMYDEPLHAFGWHRMAPKDDIKAFSACLTNPSNCSPDRQKIHCCKHFNKCPQVLAWVKSYEKEQKCADTSGSIYKRIFWGKNGRKHSGFGSNYTVDKHADSDEEEMDKTTLQDCPRPMWKEFAKSKSPLNKRKLSKMFDVKGRLLHSFRSFKLAVYQAGVEPEVRPFVWRLLLGVVNPYTTGRNRINQMQSYALQYKAMRDAVVRRFGDTAPNLDDQLRCVANMVRKDVVRTDRTLSYFAGQEDSNKNLIALFYILTTYSLTHPDVGYCQGMSDLAAPILYVMRNESEAYVCFCALMLRMKRYFLSSTNCHIILKFDHMNRLLALYDPLFHKYLNSVHSDPLLFCYRWFLLELKREFQFHDALHLMDVMWASAVSLTDLEDSTSSLKTVKLADTLQGLERTHFVPPHHAHSTYAGHTTSSNVEEPERTWAMTAGDQLQETKLKVFSCDDSQCRLFHSIPLYEVKLAFGSPTTDRLDDVVLALSSPKLYPNGERRTATNSTYSRYRSFAVDGSSHVPSNMIPSYSELSDVGAVSDCRQTNIHSSTIGQRIPTVNKPQIVPGALSCPDYILSRAVHNYLMEIRGDESDDDYDNYRRYNSYADEGLNCARVKHKPSFFKHVNVNPVPVVSCSNPIRKRHRSRSCPSKNRSILVHLKNLLADRGTAAKRRAAHHNVMSRYSTKSPNFSVLRHRRSSAATKTSSSHWSLDEFSTTSTSSFDDAMYLNILSRSLDAPVADLSDNISSSFQNFLTCSKCSKKRINFGPSNLVDDEARSRQTVGDGCFNRRLAPDLTVDENKDHMKRNSSIISAVVSAPISSSNSSSRSSTVHRAVRSHF